MAANSLNDWSTIPASNIDIAGTSIAVGCPPQDVGIFMRTAMAQIAYAVQGTGGPIPATWHVGALIAASGDFSGDVTVDGTLSVSGFSAPDLSLSGNLNVAGSTTLQNDTGIAGGLTVTGAGGIDVTAGPLSVAKDITTDSGNLLVNKIAAPAVLSLNSVGGSGRTYQMVSATNGVFAIADASAAANRMVIDTSGSTTFQGALFAPTAASGTNTTQVATTAFVKTAIGTLPDNPVGSDVANAQIRYGVFTATASGSGTVNLPNPFPTALLAVICTPESAPGTNNSFTAAPLTKGSFSWAWPSTAGGSASVQYLAFGY